MPRGMPVRQAVSVYEHPLTGGQRPHIIAERVVELLGRRLEVRMTIERPADTVQRAQDGLRLGEQVGAQFLAALCGIDTASHQAPVIGTGRWLRLSHLVRLAATCRADFGADSSGLGTNSAASLAIIASV
jgi:hypothetical protein